MGGGRIRVQPQLPFPTGKREDRGREESGPEGIKCVDGIVSKLPKYRRLSLGEISVQGCGLRGKTRTKTSIDVA